MPRFLLRSLVAAAVVAVALTASSCGGTGPLTAAVLKSSSTHGVKLDLRADVTVPQAGAVTMTGTGAVDMARRKGQLSMTVDAPSLTSGAREVRIDEVMDGRVIYMRPSGLSQALPGGKQWFKLDLGKFAEAAGVDFSALSSTGSTDPATTLRWLRASDDVEELGSETVRGVATKHYRAVIDLGKVADELPEADRQQARRAIELLRKLGGPGHIPTEAWVGKDGLVRRISMSWQQSLPGMTQPMAMMMTVGLYDYGTPVRVDPPDAADVLDLTGVAGSALKSQLR